MPIKKVKSGYKKAVKATKAAGAGTRDYSKQMKAINKAAEKKVGKSGSRVQDVKNMTKEINKMKKEQGVSWRKAVKNRMK